MILILHGTKFLKKMNKKKTVLLHKKSLVVHQLVLNNNKPTNN